MLRVELTVTGGKRSGQVILVARPKFLIGRDHDCQLRSPSELVSRHHCVISIDEFCVRIRDLGSTNGTFVNGDRVAPGRTLESGDRLSVGKLEFLVEIGGKLAEASDSDSSVLEAFTLEPDEMYLSGDTDVGPPSEPIQSHQPAVPFPPQIPVHPVQMGYPYPSYPYPWPMQPLPQGNPVGQVPVPPRDYDPGIRRLFLDLHQKLRQSSIVKRQPGWIYQYMLEVGVTLLSREPFERVVTMDAGRKSRSGQSDRTHRFLKYVCALLETVFGYSECGRVFHPERITQILRDIPPSLFCIFHVELLTDSDLEMLRGIGFSQSKHRVLYCGDNHYFTGRVFSGEIAIHDYRMQPVPLHESDAGEAAAEIIRRYTQRDPESKP